MLSPCPCCQLLNALRHVADGVNFTCKGALRKGIGKWSWCSCPVVPVGGRTNVTSATNCPEERVDARQSAILFAPAIRCSRYEGHVPNPLGQQRRWAGLRGGSERHYTFDMMCAIAHESLPLSTQCALAKEGMTLGAVSQLLTVQLLVPAPKS
eukprot:1118341-Amphidinium_carterae.1